MALLTCPECGKGVSSSATVCPHCGYPVQLIIDAGMATQIGAQNAPTNAPSQPASASTPLPSMGGQNGSTAAAPLPSMSGQNGGTAAAPLPSMSGQNGGTAAATPPLRRSNGIGIAGFILGLISLTLFWLPIVGQIIALVGLILSFVGVFRKPRVMAILGLIFSAITLLIAVLAIFNVADSFSNGIYHYYNYGNNPYDSDPYDSDIPVDTIPMPDQDFYDNLPPDTTIYVY